MPSPLSVTGLKVPRSVLKTTVSPPLTRGLPLASFNCTVMVEARVTSAVMELGEAVMVEVEASAAPTVKVTLAESAMADKFNVPVTAAGPGVVAEVRVTV